MIPTAAGKVIVPEVLMSRVILCLPGVAGVAGVAAVVVEGEGGVNMTAILLLIECSCSFLEL